MLGAKTIANSVVQIVLLELVGFSSLFLYLGYSYAYSTWARLTSILGLLWSNIGQPTSSSSLCGGFRVAFLCEEWVSQRREVLPELHPRRAKVVFNCSYRKLYGKTLFIRLRLRKRVCSSPIARDNLSRPISDCPFIRQSQGRPDSIKPAFWKWIDGRRFPVNWSVSNVPASQSFSSTH